MQVGVTVEDAVYVRDQQQQVGTGDHRHQCRELVVVPQQDLLDGDGVVLVHDGNVACLPEPFDGVAGVLVGHRVLEVTVGEQDLCDVEAEGGEDGVVELHQLCLSNGGHRLF